MYRTLLLAVFLLPFFSIAAGCSSGTGPAPKSDSAFQTPAPAPSPSKNPVIPNEAKNVPLPK